MNIERVQVATRLFSDPVPGILVKTSHGDIIYIYERITEVMGFHAPGDTKMWQITAILDEACKELADQGVNPFILDDEVPLIMENNMIFGKYTS